MRRRATVSLVIALAAPLAAAGAQVSSHWRTLDVARQLRDTFPQHLRVQYGAGKFDVRATADPLAYAMHLRYDETRSAAIHRYDAEQRSTVLGLESLDRRVAVSSDKDRDESGELRVMLPNSVPLELDLELGGTQSTLELGGLALRALRMECGATDAALMFSTPNRTRMHDMVIDVGAADFSATSLANANVDQIRVRGGVGVIDLDFGGVWTHDMTVTTRLAVGKLMLRVPSDVGVRLEIKRVATGFEHEGFVKRDDAWYSDNYERAAHKLQLRAETLFGKIEIQRGSR